MTNPTNAFLNWSRVELLRLRSFDWGNGSKNWRWLKDGVMKFNSIYLTKRLARKIGISEDEVLSAIDSPSVISELEGKSFTVSWKDNTLVLAWLEEGISETKTDLKQDYYEEDGKFYLKFRMIERIVYLDGTERIIKDTGESNGVAITKDDFESALKQIRHDRPQ